MSEDIRTTKMRVLPVREGWSFREVQVGLWQAVDPQGRTIGQPGGLQYLAVTFLGRELARWEVHGLPEPAA